MSLQPGDKVNVARHPNGNPKRVPTQWREATVERLGGSRVTVRFDDGSRVSVTYESVRKRAA